MATQPPIHWGFSRAAGDMPNANDLKAAGVNGIMFNADDMNDPDYAKRLQQAREAGMHIGFWLPYGPSKDPKEYADRIVELSQKYGAEMVMPDLEAAQEGGPGSPQWDWNQAVASNLKGRLGSTKVGVTVEPRKTKDQFNYGAWLGLGAQFFPQAFGAKPMEGDTFDPQEVRKFLLDAGVPADSINVLLAPGQRGSAGLGPVSLYTIDDVLAHPERLQAFKDAIAAAAQGGQPSAPLAQPDPSPNRNGGRVPDAQNPAALAYSRSKLGLLKRLGYTATQFGLGSLDPTAQYRALSAILGARAAIAGGHAADYQIGASTPQTVADFIRNMLATATHAEGPAGEDPRVGVAVPPSVPMVHGDVGAGSHPDEVLRSRGLPASVRPQPVVHTAGTIPGQPPQGGAPIMHMPSSRAAQLVQAMLQRRRAQL